MIMAKEKRTIREVFGEIAIDLGKLTFGGIVLAGIFDSGTDKIILVSIGFVFCVAVIATGVYLTTKENKED